MDLCGVGIELVHEIEYAKGFELREAEQSFRSLAEDHKNTESVRVMYRQLADMIKERLAR